MQEKSSLAHGSRSTGSTGRWRHGLRWRAPVVVGAVVTAMLIVVSLGTATRTVPAFAQTLTVLQATLMEPNQKTTEISTDELRQILKDGSATVFDARPPMEYAISHIPGALNVAPKAGVPMSVYVSDAAEVGRLVPDKGAPIVLYCNGPFCGKSKRLGEELLAAGFTNVRRYQLGAPTWRALVGIMQIDMDGVRYVREGDRTAVWVDARSHEEFLAGSLPGAQNIPATEVVAAKDDGRLPIEDHNTRIVVFGSSTEQAVAATTEIAKNAFHNVTYFAGTLGDLTAGLGEVPVVAAR